MSAGLIIVVVLLLVIVGVVLYFVYNKKSSSSTTKKGSSTKKASSTVKVSPSGGSPSGGNSGGGGSPSESSRERDVNGYYGVKIQYADSNISSNSCMGYDKDYEEVELVSCDKASLFDIQYGQINASGNIKRCIKNNEPNDDDGSDSHDFSDCAKIDSNNKDARYDSENKYLINKGIYVIRKNDGKYRLYRDRYTKKDDERNQYKNWNLI